MSCYTRAELRRVRRLDAAPMSGARAGGPPAAGPVRHVGEEAHAGERNRRSGKWRHNWLRDDEPAMYRVTDGETAVAGILTTTIRL